MEVQMDKKLFAFLSCHASYYLTPDAVQSLGANQSLHVKSTKMSH
jgi:hypothetical protein